MKNYLLTDFCAGLCLLAIICVSGFTYMHYKTNQIEESLKTIPAVEVKKEMLARNATKAELTMFERQVKHTE